MVLVCQICGDSGYEDLLVFCKKCHVAVEHRYCLDIMKDDNEQDVHWLCEQCDDVVTKVNFSNELNIESKGWPRRHDHYGIFKQLGHHRVENECFAGYDMNQPLLSASHVLVEDVLDVATLSGQSKSSNLTKNDIPSSSSVEKNDMHPGEGYDELRGMKIESKKMTRRRKLILDDESDEDGASLPVDNGIECSPFSSPSMLSAHALLPPFSQTIPSLASQPDNSLASLATECYSHLPARPIIHSVWRGQLTIHGRKYGPVVVHLSNKACDRVCNAAGKLPQVLNFEKLPLLDAWPKRFNSCSPTADDVGVYFFPEDARNNAVLEDLIGDMIEQDLALEVIVDEAELVVFASVLLPQQCHLFDGLPYLWGVFKRRPSIAVETCRTNWTEAAVPSDEGKNEPPQVIEDASRGHLSNLNSESDGVLVEPESSVDGVCMGGPAPLGREVPDSNKLSGGDKNEPSRTGYSVSGLSTCRISDLAAEFSFGGEYESDVEAASCLELFPLGADNLGIPRKIRDNKEVDLDLGLAIVKDRDRSARCTPPPRRP